MDDDSRIPLNVLERSVYDTDAFLSHSTKLSNLLIYLRHHSVVNVGGYGSDTGCCEGDIKGTVFNRMKICLLILAT